MDAREEQFLILTSRRGKGEGEGRVVGARNEFASIHKTITNKTNLYLIPTLFFSMVYACACLYSTRLCFINIS